MILSKGKFLQYQNTFYRTLLSTPTTCDLLTVQPSDDGETTSEANFDDFVGDSPRLANIVHTFQCLYDKIINNQQREKYGVTQTANGVIFLSPNQLIPVYGTFIIDNKKTKVMFQSRMQVIQKIDYLEEIYGSCVGVLIAIEDDLKGGQ